jgi:hypothetical protein
VKGERVKLYEAAEDFYELEGNIVMILTPSAAAEVCLMAAEQDLVVFRVEGGFWHAPGFEARLDCIWDGADPPISVEDAAANNRAAAEYIRVKSDIHNAFVVSAAPLSGYPHKRAQQR